MNWFCICYYDDIYRYYFCSASFFLFSFSFTVIPFLKFFQEEILKLFVDIKTMVVPHIPPPPVIPKPPAESPEPKGSSPEDSPHKKHRRGHSNASTVSPPQTPLPPTSLAINQNSTPSKVASQASSPTASPSSPHLNKQVAKSAHMSPPPRSPVAKAVAAGKSPAKSPKKAAS